MKKNCVSVFAVLLISTSTAYSQSQFTGWLASFNTFKTGKKTSIHADIQYRSADKWQRMQTLLARTGLNVHLTKQFTVTAGYAFIDNYRSISGVSGYAPEHRIWEQLLFNHNWKRVLISHRARVEQRFISRSIVRNNELENEGSQYANRFRYFIRNILPFNKEPSFTKGAFAALQNEVFLNFGNSSPVNGKTFDQNRLYLAVGYRLRKSFDLEAGYLNQYISGRGSTFTNNHVLQLAGYLRL
jgi:hypothetical protein